MPWYHYSVVDLTKSYGSFSTGYRNIRPSMKSIFGSETIDRTTEVWGLDSESELRGCYRPSGHPGVRSVFSINLLYHAGAKHIWFSQTVMVCWWRFLSFEIHVKTIGESIPACLRT